MAQYTVILRDDSRVIDGKKVVVDNYSNASFKTEQEAANFAKGYSNARVAPYNPARQGQEIIISGRKSNTASGTGQRPDYEEAKSKSSALTSLSSEIERGQIKGQDVSDLKAQQDVIKRLSLNQVKQIRQQRQNSQERVTSVPEQQYQANFSDISGQDYYYGQPQPKQRNFTPLANYSSIKGYETYIEPVKAQERVTSVPTRAAMQFTRNGAMTAASSELRAATTRGKIKEQTSGILSNLGAAVFMQPPPGAENQVQAAAYTFGLPAGIALSRLKLSWLKIPGSSTVTRNSVKAYQSVEKALQSLYSTKIGRQVVAGTTTLGVGQATYKGVELGVEATSSKQVKALKEQYGGEELYGQAYKNALNNNGVDIGTGKNINLKSIISGIPGTEGLPYVNKVLQPEVNAATKAVREQLAMSGATMEEAATLSKGLEREFKGRDIATLASFIGSGATTEFFGRRFFAKDFKELGTKGISYADNKVFSKLFGKGFGVIAPLGVSEGVSQSLVQQQSEGNTINAKRTAIEGALAGAFAGGLGGLIVGTIGKPKTNFIFRSIGNIADPTEFPGDLTATGFEQTVKKVTGREFSQPKVYMPVGTPSVAFSPSSLQQGVTPNINLNILNMDTTQKGRKTPTYSYVQPQTRTNVKIPTPSFTETKNPLPTPTITETNPIVPIPIENIQPRVPINIPITTDTNTPTPISTETQTNAFNFAVSTNIPVQSPQLRIPPLIPLGLPSVTRGQATKAKGNKYFNELQAGNAALQSFLFTNEPKRQKKTKAKPKSKKKKGNGVNQPFLWPDVDLSGLIFK